MKNNIFENYGCFPADLLAPVIKRQEDPERDEKLREKARKLEETLKSFVKGLWRLRFMRIRIRSEVNDRHFISPIKWENKAWIEYNGQ